MAFNAETVTSRPGKTVAQVLLDPKEAWGLHLAEPPAPVRPGAMLTTFEVERG